MLPKLKTQQADSILTQEAEDVRHMCRQASERNGFIQSKCLLCSIPTGSPLPSSFGSTLEVMGGHGIPASNIPGSISGWWGQAVCCQWGAFFSGICPLRGSESTSVPPRCLLYVGLYLLRASYCKFMLQNGRRRPFDPLTTARKCRLQYRSQST